MQFEIKKIKVYVQNRKMLNIISKTLGEIEVTTRGVVKLKHVATLFADSASQKCFYAALPCENR